MTTTLAQRMIVAWFSTSLLVVPAAPARTENSKANEESTKLHALFEDEWQWSLREYPEFATSVGDHRYNDKLTDLSVAAIDRRKAHDRYVLKRIRASDRTRLTGQDVLSYDLFVRTAEDSVALQRFPAGMIPLEGFMMPYEWMPICQMSGVHIDIPESRSLAGFRPRSSAPAALSSTPACTPWAERVSKPSIT